MVLVSACLLGIRCRYDNKILRLSKKDRKFIKQLVKNNVVIPICPEQLGGLSTPRSPAKIKKGKVITKSGTNVTKNFYRGAQQVTKIVRLLNIKTAYLKNRSPSCGKNGITTRSLRKLNIRIHFI